MFFILLCQIQTIRFDKENSLHPIRACLAYPNRISKNDPDNEVTQTEISSVNTSAQNLVAS